MEIANFLTWLIFIGLITGIGIGAMVYAYLGQGSVSILFTEIISTSSSIPTEAAVNFQQGCEAYQRNINKL